jgi:hypothetical protein
MPPKTGKRKATTKKPINTKKAIKASNAVTTPDRLTWPGWVEMESEPAFFNVMLKEMGVRGIKVNEVWSMDDNCMAMLPRPVHALIFLFRYQATDKTKLETECPKQVWYAEQVPDFACATFALLNIVNNIPGLEMGQELRAFKQRTQDMTPRLRGDAIDDFTFVKQIHNSFARDEDLLNADSHLKDKLTKARKEQAVAKAKKTKAANAAARAAKSNPPEKEVSKSGRVTRSSPPQENSSKTTPVKSTAPKENSSKTPPDVKSGPLAKTVAEGTRAPRSSPSVEEAEKRTPAKKSTSALNSSSPVETPKEESPKGTRTSKRNKKPTIKAAEASPNTPSKSAPSSKTKASKSPAEPDAKLPNDHTTPKKGKAKKSPDDTPTKVKTNGATTLDHHYISSSSSTSSKRKRSDDGDDEVTEITEKDIKASSLQKSKADSQANKKLKLNAPKKAAATDPDADFATTTEQATSNNGPRRSGRQPKPRKDLLPAAEHEEEESAAAVEAQAFDEEGFHFCAYMPIGDRVWKLDGMDGFPQDMGPIEDGVDWLNIARPALQERVAQYAAGAIEFNLMAIVHDPMVACTEALAANVKALEATEAKLTTVVEDWKELLDEDEDISALVNGRKNKLGLHNADIERASLTDIDQQALANAEDLTDLLALRKEIILQQNGLRHACETEMWDARRDITEAKLRRQDHMAYCEEHNHPTGTLDLDTGVYKKGKE